MQLVFQSFRYSVLKDLIQFFMLYIYNNICKHNLISLLILPELL